MRSWYTMLWIARNMYQILTTLILYTIGICDLAINLTMLLSFSRKDRIWNPIDGPLKAKLHDLC
jgi:hypothetical protein